MTKKILLAILFVLVHKNVLAQQTGDPNNYNIKSKMIDFSPDNILVEGDLGNFKIDLTSTELENGLDLVKIKLSAKTEELPPKFTIKWKVLSNDIYKFWNPDYSVDQVNFYYNSITSSSTRHAPVISFMDKEDLNRFTFALADGLNQVQMDAGLVEEDVSFHCRLTFFAKENTPIKEYSTELLIDRRGKPFYEILKEVTDWWSGHKNYKPAYTPEAAKDPMYSTWYNFHQNIEVETMLAESREGKKYGIDAIIIDDGWQTLDGQRGYAYTGDWQPDRINDMPTFVNDLHLLGTKVLLWYSVPFVGKHAKNYNRFKGKYLYEWESQGTFILDPRYPEVREFIINTYEQALIDWKLDGFKFDFLGFFRPDSDTKLTKEKGRDHASVDTAVDDLMTEVMKRLQKINPNVVIEFRQPYIGPLMRKYGNMFRASDCPNMAVINRVRTVNVRLLAGESAVHADPIIWNNEDPVEVAALQLLNPIFAVPQISVKLNQLPEDHKRMLAFWLGYWKSNREYLLNKGFYPNDPEALYPKVSAGDDQKMITAIYNDVFVENNYKEAPKNLDVLNARKNTNVILINSKDFGNYHYEIFNCQGTIVESGTTRLNLGAILFNVPPSGMLSLKR
ncbi:glycoside hydrolase family 36 protein [Arenibacter sp. ARW7G5Y1]|uniref:glycoside hydrolase family 36 protein n=1 Tax=Arenibacter sp. ARW7G5Y1 TaxID=2135619 RepID=UPI000D7592D5|nr:glycoside hydrolase family 36 protein [Arenibacter sp. ARW7G5Y1]PXX21707.1 alpha-galactosidase [Arenibacter sp. ARW7G5Y1]